MSTTLVFGLLSFVVFVLAIYLGFLYRQLAHQNQELTRKEQERRQHVESSIHIIALATLQDQCDLSECCIRLKHLMDIYAEDFQQQEFSVVRDFYSEIKQFPTHKKRLDQTKQEIFNQDKQRFAIEEKYRMEMLKCLELLVTKFKKAV